MAPTSISAHLLAPRRRRITLVPAADGWIEGPRPIDLEAVVGAVAGVAVVLGVASAALREVSEPLASAGLVVAGGLLLLAVLAVLVLYALAAVGVLFGVGQLATRRGRARAAGQVRTGIATLSAALRAPPGSSSLAELAAAHPRGVPVARAAVARVDVEPGGLRRRALVTFHDGSTRRYRSWRRSLPEILGVLGERA